VVGPALVARPPQPGVELVLDRALDDQPRSELRELRELLARVLADSDGKQLLLTAQVSLVGLAGLEGTYAVSLTALRRFTSVGDATPAPFGLLLMRYRS
jgi:hypothetical protein